MSDKWGASWEAWNNNRDSNYNRALEEYNQRVADAVKNYYDTAGGPGGKYYFRDDDPNAEYNSVVDKLQNQDIKNMQSYLDNNFAGLGGSNMWLNNYWNGNELNDLTNTFITNNYNNALDKLDQAYSSGYLNNSGYNNALNALNTQRSAAQTTVGDIGRGILDDYKTDLTNKAQGYLTDLTNYNLNKSNSINADAWNRDFNDYYNQQKNNLESKFNYATSGLNLFDTGDILGNAKANQGVTNANLSNGLADSGLNVADYYNNYKKKTVNNNQNENFNSNLYNAINEQNTKKQNKLGLGNSGLF